MYSIVTLGNLGTPFSGVRGECYAPYSQVHVANEFLQGLKIQKEKNVSENEMYKRPKNCDFECCIAIVSN